MVKNTLLLILTHNYNAVTIRRYDGNRELYICYRGTFGSSDALSSCAVKVPRLTAHGVVVSVCGGSERRVMNGFAWLLRVRHVARFFMTQSG